MTNHTEHYFTYLLVIGVSFWWHVCSDPLPIFKWGVVKILYRLWIHVLYQTYDLQRKLKHSLSSFCYRFILPVVHLEQSTSGPPVATSTWLISSMALKSWTWQTHCTPRWVGNTGAEPWYLGLISWTWCQTIHDKFETQTEWSDWPKVT